MGLDAYLYMARRATDDEMRGLESSGGLSSDGLIIFRDDDPAAYKTINPIIRKVVLPETKFNRAKWDADHPEVAGRAWKSMSNFAGGDVKIAYEVDGRRFDYELTCDEWDSYYDLTVERTYCAFKSIEIAYWRKNWDLQERIENALDIEIGDCDYIQIPEWLIRKMVDDDIAKNGSEFTRIPIIGKDWCYVYYPWW